MAGLFLLLACPDSGPDISADEIIEASRVESVSDRGSPSSDNDPQLTAPPPGLPPTPEFWGWPLSDRRITSPFGWRLDPSGSGSRSFHRGVDFGAATGTPVLAIADGRIKKRGRDAHLGLFLVLEHHDGIESVYAHLDDTPLVEGLRVEKGAQIASSGNSGRSFAPHLHLSLRRGEELFDPLEQLGRAQTPIGPAPRAAALQPPADSGESASERASDTSSRDH